MKYIPIEFSNISVVDAPLLKDYYWNYLNIKDLNEKLLHTPLSPSTTIKVQSSVMRIPAMPENSNSIKIIFHMYNTSNEKNIDYQINRIKRCNCIIQETAVTINTFKMKYNCPHRSMLDISQRNGCIQPKKFEQLSLRISYDVAGLHHFVFEIKVSEKVSISLNFEMLVLEFDPIRCIITGALLPVQNDDYYSFYQPIWIFNQYGRDLHFHFSTEEHSLKIVTPCVTVKKYSIHPLIVRFKPDMDGWSTLVITMSYHNINSDFKIKAKGIQKQTSPIQYSPLNEIQCEDAPYIILENSLFFNVRLTEDVTQMVVVYNYTDKCVECKWIRYIVNDYFEIECIPKTFLCKPNHPFLCIVKVIAKNRRCFFHHVPLTLEIHRFKIPPLNTDFEELHSEMESIDDPKIFEPTLLSKLYLNVNLQIEGLPEINLLNEHENDKLMKLSFPVDSERNIIEKFLWREIFSDHFLNIMVNNNLNRTNCTYEELINEESKPTRNCAIEKSTMKLILRQLLSNSLIEIAKQWRYIPSDLVL